MMVDVPPDVKLAEVEYTLRGVRNLYREACTSYYTSKFELAHRIFILETIADEYRWIIRKQKASK